MSECIEPSIEPVYPHRTHILVSGTAGSRTGGSWARVGCAEHSLCSILTQRVPRVAVQGRSQEALAVRYAYLQLGNPAICVYVCVHMTSLPSWCYSLMALLCGISSKQGAHLHMQTNDNNNKRLVTIHGACRLPFPLHEV